MKKAQNALILAVSFLLLTSCGENGSVSQDTSVPQSHVASLSDFKNAIKELGTNYTLNSIDYSGDEGKTVVSENYYGKFMPSGQIDGYMRVTDDDDTIHYYVYSPEIADEYYDGFDDFGREDYSSEDFARMKDLEYVLNLDTFTQSIRDRKGLTFHTDDELSILRLLDLTNHVMAYFFGHAHDGIDVILDENFALKQINFLGVNQAMLDKPVALKNNIFYSITVDDIGTSKIDYIDEYANGGMEVHTPEVSMLLRMGEDGKPLYDGVRAEFTGVVSSIINAGASTSIISNGAPAFFPDAGELDPWVYYLHEVTVRATVSSLDGAVVFTDIELVEDIEEADEPSTFQVTDADTWLDEFVYPSHGQAMNGMSLDLTVTYLDGEIIAGEDSVLNCQFNSEVPVKVVLSKDMDEDTKSEFGDWFWSEEIESGVSLDFKNVTFRWENGPVVYVGDTSRVERSITFTDFTNNVLGEALPEPPSIDSFDMFFEESYLIDEDTAAVGVFIIARVLFKEKDTFVEEYANILTEAGYEFVEQYDDDAGDTWYAYQKDNIVIRYLTPFKVYDDPEDTEHRTWIEAFNLDDTFPAPNYDED
ncbi:MAG: hypothetical protein J1F32_04765 [Erysipelotrichales bacterium]|nr:hypothetical protein [Erysipelotrichales bacterium]